MCNATRYLILRTNHCMKGWRKLLFLELDRTVFLLLVEKKIILMPGGEFYIRPDIGIKLWQLQFSLTSRMTFKTWDLLCLFHIYPRDTHKYISTHSLYVFVMLEKCANGYTLYLDAKNQTAILFISYFSRKK